MHGRHRSRSSRDKGSGGIALLGLALFIVGYVGVFFANLIKSAVSRQREFLADASAVQFTRNPHGIAGALAKIANLGAGSRVNATHASEASHLFFSNALSSSFISLLATHPPLKERIQRIAPSFDIANAQAAREPSASRPAKAPPAPGVSSLAAEPQDVLNSVGAPTTAHLDHAAGLLAALPEQLHRGIRDPYGARAVIYALLLDSRPDIRARQCEHLKANADPQVVGEVERVSNRVAQIPPESRLPLADLAVPALRTLSRDQYASFRACVEALVGADEAVDLSEYALQRLLMQHLDSHFGKQARKMAQYYSLEPLIDDCARLLGCLAYWGADTQDDAQRAFDAGASVLPGDAHDMPPLDNCGLQMVDDALARLDLLSMPLKRIVIDACARCVLCDRMVRTEEGELLRAVADSLGCPMPPLLGRN
jgi:hypothetical protein